MLEIGSLVREGRERVCSDITKYKALYTTIYPLEMVDVFFFLGKLQK